MRVGTQRTRVQDGRAVARYLHPLAGTRSHCTSSPPRVGTLHSVVGPCPTAGLRMTWDDMAIAENSCKHLILRWLYGSANGDRNRRFPRDARSEEHTSELQSLRHLVCR